MGNMQYSKLSKKDLIRRITELEDENRDVRKKLDQKNELNSEFSGLNSHSQLKLAHALLAASNMIPQCQTFVEAAGYIFTQLKDLIKADAGYIALLNKETRMNDVVYLEPGSQECTVDSSLPMPIRGFRATVYKSKEIKYQNDFQNTKWNRLMPEGHTTLHNVMFVPMIVDEEVIGLIGLSNKPGGFNDDDLPVAKEFALLAVIALNYSKNLEEKNQYQKELKDSEEKYRLMIDNSPMMIWESGMDGKCTFFNKRWLDFRGREMHEETGDGWTEGLHPDDYDNCIRDYLANFKQQQKFKLEYRLLNAHGEYRCILDIGMPQYNSDGSFKGYVGSCIDITEQKQLEKTQKEREKFYHALFEKNKAIKLLINPVTGKIEDANTAASEFYGYSLSELRAMKITDINQLNKEQVDAEMQKALKDERKFFEFRHKLANGEIRDVAVYSGPVNYKGNDLLYSIINDITEKKKAENKLKESEEKYRNLYEKTPVMLHSIDSEGRLISVSDYWLQKLGYTKEEVIGRKSLEFLTPQSQEKFYKYFPGFKEKGEINNMAYQMVRKNGERMDVLLSAISEKNLDGTLKRTLAVIIDVTEQKKAEIDLAKLERKSNVWLENSPVCTKILDIDFNLQYMSQTGIRELQIEDINEFYGKPYPFHFYPDSFKIPMNENLRKAKETGKTITQEAFVNDIKGNKLWYHSTIVPVYNTDNKLDYMMVVSSEITKRKKAEEELKRAYNLYRTLVSNLPNINAYLFDKDKRIIIAEGAGFKEGNYSRSDFEGHIVTELKLEKHVLDYLDHLYTDALHGQNVSGELHYKDRWYHHMAVPVKDHKNNVLGGISISQNITPQKLAYSEIDNYKDKLKHLTRHLQQIIEKEKTALAREIHDELGQNLTFVKLNLALLGKNLTIDRETSEHIQLQNAYDMIDNLIKKVKKVSAELRPTLIDDLGIIAAMDWHLNEFCTLTGVKYTFDYTNEDLRLDKDLAINMYRILQEALTNCAKYAKATKLHVSLNIIDNELVFNIDNNGIGIKEKELQKANSFGIIGMRERVDLFNGSFSIKGSAKGTFINITIPIK